MYFKDNGRKLEVIEWDSRGFNVRLVEGGLYRKFRYRGIWGLFSGR